MSFRMQRGLKESFVLWTAQLDVACFWPQPTVLFLGFTNRQASQPAHTLPAWVGWGGGGHAHPCLATVTLRTQLSTAGDPRPKPESDWGRSLQERPRWVDQVGPHTHRCVIKSQVPQLLPSWSRRGQRGWRLPIPRPQCARCPLIRLGLFSSFFNFNFSLFIFGCTGSSLLSTGFL